MSGADGIHPNGAVVQLGGPGADKRADRRLAGAVSALRAIGEANEAVAAAQGSSAGLEGHLRIAAPVTFSRLHLVAKLGSFLDAHPKVQLDIVMDDREVDLVAENIDGALRIGVLTDSALPARKLAQAERLVVASPAYLARRGVPREPEDLLQHDGVSYGQDSGAQEWLFRCGTSQTSAYLRTGLKLSAAEGVREAVLAGYGFAIASTVDVCEGTQIGRSGERSR